MMQQGLGALMPQLPAGQAPANPTRLAAAMDVVTSDAEEQILDPRTLALIKYKDAVQAMQSADQLMAASRPAPTPPTVAERTKLAAEQGIMGLASRLAPGLQQQGNRMGAAQMQQAMTGGLPQLPSPNMARMAGGGIVGYAPGGDVKEEDAIVGYDGQGNPIYASDLARLANAGAIDETAEGAARRAAYAALQRERPDFSEIAQSPEAPKETRTAVPTNTYGMGDRTGQLDTLKGMVSGTGDLIRSGLGSLAPRGMSDEEIAAETAVTRRAAPRGMSDEEIAAETAITRRAPPRSGMTDESPTARTTNALDSAYIMGLGGSDSPSTITMGERISSALDRFKTAMGYTDPRAAERAEREAEILAQYEVVKRAQQERVANRQARRLADQGTGLDAMYAMGLGLGSTSGAGTAAPATTAPTAAAPATTTPTAAAPAATAPAPARRQVERIPEAEALAAISPSGPKTAVEYLMEYGQAPEKTKTSTAAPARDARDERLRRIIAGLRGMGAQGLGGYAAGSAAEQERIAQEIIDAQERSRAARMEERELGLKDRELTLMDALRRDQLEEDIRAREEAQQQRMTQMEIGKQEFLQEQISAATQNLDFMINNLQMAIMMGDDDEEKMDQLQQLRQQRIRIIEEVEAQLGRYMSYGAQTPSGLNANDFTVRQLPAQ